MTDKCVHCFVTGQVQGVFYRANTQKKANALGLTGWVRNCLDGRVELVACGEEEAVEALVAWLWEGPRASRVESVQVESIEIEFFEGFNVLKTQ